MMLPGRKYSAGSGYRYGFNAQEKSDEIGEGLTTAMYWEYDSRIGRRWNVDPLPKIEESSYLSFSGNPILITDLLGNSGTSIHTDKDGKVIAVFDDGDLGIYKHGANADGKTPTLHQITKRHKKSTDAGGELMGKTLSTYSFHDSEYGGDVGKINFGSTDAIMWQYKNMSGVKSATNSKLVWLYEYASNAGSYEKYDYKTNGMIKQADGTWGIPTGYENEADYVFRGSLIAPGVYESARNFGNYFAGRVAKAADLDKKTFLVFAGMFQLSGNNLKEVKNHFAEYYIKAYNSYPFHGEKPTSNIYQRIGYEGANTPERLKALGSNLWK